MSENNTDITVEDVKEWIKQLEAERVVKRWGGVEQKISMSEDTVYFNGPLYGSCTREKWDNLMKKAIENLSK